MNSKPHERPIKVLIRNTSKVLLCLMMTIAMAIPAALPEVVYADQGSAAKSSAGVQSDQSVKADKQKTSEKVAKSDANGSQAKAEQTVRTAKTQNISGMTLVFKRNVMSDERLQMRPGSLVANGNRKSVEVSWDAVENPSGIDGYIILRKDPESAVNSFVNEQNNVGNAVNGTETTMSDADRAVKNAENATWRRIAAVENNVTTFTDEEASEPNVLYSYTVVAYKRINGVTKVSEPAQWAGAVTTRSDSKNVYECKITNLANVVSVMAGSCAKTELKIDDKAYSTVMRWSSSNNAVATVDETGLVSGVAAGKATIFARSHTGTVTSFEVNVTTPGSAQAMIDTFSAWMGYNRINGKQNGIIDIYNSVTPWPQGYKMRYSDAWCDATISAAAIKTGNVDKIGRECSVPRHIDIFRKLGIWEEDGTITPKPGDIIVYSWRRFRQPNNASASHIGLVVKVENGQITCIEGNRGIGVVDTRTIPVGWGCIRGYARPHYEN